MTDILRFLFILNSVRKKYEGVNMKKTRCDALRRLARQAKNRLSGRNCMEGNGYKVYSGGLLAEYKLVRINEKEDERLYEKVSEILNENIDTINPIGRLADSNRMNAMNTQEKERYIFNLIDKYAEMRRRFEREQFVS